MTVSIEQLNSSWLTRAQYDDETQVLTVTTKTGQSYDSQGVPENVYQGLITASSPGSYWRDNIKDVYA